MFRPGQGLRWLRRGTSAYNPWKQLSPLTPVGARNFASKPKPSLPTPSVPHFQAYHSTSGAANKAPSRHESSKIPITIGNETVEYSSIVLRDACACPACVHESTRQRLFSIADVPATIRAKSIEVDSASDTVSIKWENDAPGFIDEHTTQLSLDSLHRLNKTGSAPGSQKDSLESQFLWTLEPLNLPDYNYDVYMKDDRALNDLVIQLRTKGLAFVTGVPGTEEALATIATRIGPIKDTFYGYTWDVRTVPQAVNAAYTSGDLGFHTDLLYFQNPPHVQLLHCVQSASTGGASVFADAYRAAVDLFFSDREAFDTLATVPVNYHYNHPDSNVYHTTKPVIDLKPLRIGDTVYTRLEDYLEDAKAAHGVSDDQAWIQAAIVDCMDKINWGPPFLAPFSNHESSVGQTSNVTPVSQLNKKADRWHDAAFKFNALLQRSEYLYERKMNPGECVLFDNTRTLHSRRAFDQADVGKPRWLRGTYVDKDPYLSRWRVLRNKYGH